jgi:hypothetical protein
MESETLAAARDISIILVAIESLIIGVLLAVLVIQLARLSKLLREELLPILAAAQDTMGNVRGTTTFVGDHVVQPVVKWSSYAAGVRGGLSALVGIRKATSRRLPGE